jgi:hypothetical protein
MTSQPPVRQYSPDGRYWWDGQAWQPTLPPGEPPYHAAPGGVARRTKPRVPPWRLAPLVALLVGTLAGAGIGSVIAAARTHPHGPSAPPTLPAAFPDGDQRYLARVTLPFLTDWMTKDNDYTCGQSPDLKASYGGKHLLECNAPGASKDVLYVDIEYDDETHVLAVKAGCHLRPGASACKSLFGAFADALMAQNQPDLRGKAEDWAGRNTDSDEAATFGGMRFEIALQPHFIHATAVA